MRLNLKKLLLFVLISGLAATGAMCLHSFCFTGLSAAGRELNGTDNQAEMLRAFAALDPIDTHVHAFKSDPEITDLMDHLQLHILDICVADTHGTYAPLDEQRHSCRLAGTTHACALLLIRSLSAKKISPRRQSNDFAKNLWKARSR
jgi:hypothetical protein